MRAATKTYIGDPCPHGHNVRYVSTNGCVVCRRKLVTRWGEANKARRSASAKLRYQANKEKINEASAAWHKANKEKRKKSAADWYQANKVRKNDTSKAWREANKEKNLQYNRDWNEANKERKRVTSKAWHKANPDKARAAEHRRRARLLSAGGTFSDQDIKSLAQSQPVCNGCPVNFGDVPHTIDHIVPLARGGSNWPSNLQLLCQPCNDSKGAKTMEEWKHD